jgi:hypothetical protein
MAEKIRPCMGGIVRHSWYFIRNVEQVELGPSSGSFKLRGRYGCRNPGCAARKYGPPQTTKEPGDTSPLLDVIERLSGQSGGKE